MWCLSKLVILITGLFTIQPSIQDKSLSTMTGMGWEFVPAASTYPPTLTCTTKKRLHCSLECNKRVDCRTFDYDETSRQCRLWDVDTTTGSIIVSPTKPRSSVGTIQLSPGTYANIYNQSCDKCIQSRYLICDTNTNTCQCPTKTYWNGSMCSVQLLRNQICSRTDACRSDLNLSCDPNCDLTYRCSTTVAMGVGQTVAGRCNDSTGTSANSLHRPYGIYISQTTGVLYAIAYENGSVHSFSPFSRTGHLIYSGGANALMDIFVDSLDTLYVTNRLANDGTLYIQQGSTLRSIPVAGQSTSSCPLTGLYNAYGVAVDRFGNIYVSMRLCYMVTKWTLNATTGVLVAGQPLNWGATNILISSVRFIHLDDINGALYVCDAPNNRIQKFIVGGNGTGVTVAGNGVAGTGLNQLNDPAGLWVTRDGQTLYVADYGNHRVMKWSIGASQGSVFAGSATGVSGSTNQLFNSPSDIALDPTETYLYVSDYYNNRVQRFRLR